MTLRPLMLMAIALATSADCGATGGTIGGLIPAPKFLKGEIKNDIYHAPHGALSVAVPFAKGTYEFKYMQITEQFKKDEGFVLFGPAAFDQGRYRVEVLARRDGVDTLDAFNTDAPILMGDAKNMMQEDGRAPLEELARDELSVNGRPTRHEQARQHMPAGVLSNQPEVLTYDFYIMQFGNKAVVAIIIRPEKSVADPPAISVAAFVQSIQVP